VSASCVNIDITLYYIASVDGFIASLDDSTCWSGDSWQAYISECTKCGHLVMGRRTYELFLSDKSVSPSSFDSLTVVSTTLKTPARPLFIAENPLRAVEYLESLGVSRAILLGGATTAGTFLREGLIRHVRLDLEPMLLGTGIRMFEDLSAPQTLTLLSSTETKRGVVSNFYRVER